MPLGSAYHWVHGPAGSRHQPVDLRPHRRRAQRAADRLPRGRHQAGRPLHHQRHGLRPERRAHRPAPAADHAPVCEGRRLHEAQLERRARRHQLHVGEDLAWLLVERDDPVLRAPDTVRGHRHRPHSPQVHRGGRRRQVPGHRRGAHGFSYHPPSVGPDSCYPYDPSEELFGDSSPFYWRTQIYAAPSVTSPIQSFSDYPAGAGAPAGTNSTSAVPAHGRAAWTSSWRRPRPCACGPRSTRPTRARTRSGCAGTTGPGSTGTTSRLLLTLHDSNKNGSIVRKTLGPGSHRIEWAYREGGAMLADNIILRSRIRPTSGRAVLRLIRASRH